MVRILNFESPLYPCRAYVGAYDLREFEYDPLATFEASVQGFEFRVRNLQLRV